MNILNKIWLRLNKLTDVPSDDPDDARRRRLLNIILVGMGVISILTMAIIFIALISKAIPSGDATFILITAAAVVFGAIIFYLINRYWSGQLASILFLMFFMGVLTLADSPDELANGRSLFIFVLPIIMASVLLGSQATLIFYVLTSLEMSMVALYAEIVPNIPAIISFLFLALIAWLSSRSLEQALRDLRVINTELDQRVEDRTRELSESLEREEAQASQRAAILQGIADGVVVFDTKGKAIMANPAIGRLMEIPPEEIQSKNVDEILALPHLDEQNRDSLAKSIRATDAVAAPMRIQWGDKTLSVNAAPVRDQKGKLIGNVAVFRDFTREAEIEQMKNTFVAMVSHELRTPLNAILGYSEMLKEAFYGPLNEKQQGAAERILSNSRRLLDIVSDLLDKAQIEAGRLKLSFSQFKSADLTMNMHSVMDKICGDKGLELKSSIDPDVPEMIKGDPHRLQQIMVNLVNNAAKFTEKGGITVHVYMVDESAWAFDVTDTGPGIPPNAQQYIFDPFRQVDGTATRSHGGIGLGLSIVKRLVELMGGRIYLRSTVGKGSTFTVLLPLVPPSVEVK